MSNYKLEVENTEKLKDDIENCVSDINKSLNMHDIGVGSILSLNDIKELIVNNKITPREFSYTDIGEINGEYIKDSGTEFTGRIDGYYTYNNSKYIVVFLSKRIYIFDCLPKYNFLVVGSIQKASNKDIKTYMLSGKLMFTNINIEFDLNTNSFSGNNNLKVIKSPCFIDENSIVTFSYFNNKKGTHIKASEYDKATITEKASGEYILNTSSDYEGYFIYSDSCGDGCGYVIQSFHKDTGVQWNYSVSFIVYDTNEHSFRDSHVKLEGYDGIQEYPLILVTDTKIVTCKTIKSESDSKTVIYDINTRTNNYMNSKMNTPYDNGCGYKSYDVSIDGKSGVFSDIGGFFYNIEDDIFIDVLFPDGFTGSVLEHDELLVYSGKNTESPLNLHISKIK